MHYDAPPRRSSAGTVVLVMFLLGFMLLIGLVVFGVGALMFARTRAQEVRVVMAQDMAMRETARAQAEQARAGAEALRERVTAEVQDTLSALPPSSTAAEPTQPSEPPQAPDTASSIRIANREVTIQLDEGGKIQMDGAACELAQLKESLEKAGEGREDAMVVVVRPDKRCFYEHVAGVLSVCKELNLPHVRIETLGD